MRRSWGRTSRVTAAAAAVLAGALSLSACSSDSGSGGGSSAESITVYNAQHEDLVTELAKAFTKETGIEVKMRNGGDFELANQIAQEGSASPADVFLTENSPAMDLVDTFSLFSPVEASTLAQIPAQYQPSTKSWVGFAARSTVLVYNPSKLTEAQLPTSLMDLQNPEWKGKFGFAAGGADFQAIAGAVLTLKGADETATWLKGLKDNGKVYASNLATMKAVDAGEIGAGVIYHYYWYQDQAESGANSDNTKLHFFKGQDPGAFVSVSGAGVLKASKKQELAQKFVAYLTGQAGQTVLADSTALEYTLNPDVPANQALPPLSELDPPTLDISKLSGPMVVKLMQGAGLL